MSTVLAFIAYELACNHDIQQKLHEEISQAHKTTNEDVPSYDNLHKLRYLDMVINETMRKWPPIAGTDRQCTKSYKMENADGTTVNLVPGDSLWISFYGIHRDPEYWPDPERFDPERFNEENRPNIKQCTYLPFGNGQRTCIASRFAIMVLKTLCYLLINEFSFEKCDKTPVPMRLKPGTINMIAEGGFWIKLKRRNNTKT